MASIDDWAAKVAQRIVTEVDASGDSLFKWVSDGGGHLDYMGVKDVRRLGERIAAIIETHAKPLLTLVRESRRSHYHCGDSWYCCGRCIHPDHSSRECFREGHEHDITCYQDSHDGEAARKQGICNCGADAWNARVDAAVSGRSDQ